MQKDRFASDQEATCSLQETRATAMTQLHSAAESQGCQLLTGVDSRRAKLVAKLHWKLQRRGQWEGVRTQHPQQRARLLVDLAWKKRNHLQRARQHLQQQW